MPVLRRAPYALPGVQEGKSASRPLVACAIVWGEVRAFIPDDTTCHDAITALVTQFSDAGESTALVAGRIYR